MGRSTDNRGFRDALGQFATGVTIITTVDDTGAWIGLTANSFNSASIDPPLVLWSLSKGSTHLEVFMETKHFAVNILAADQTELSTRFSSVVKDRFVDLNCQQGVGGVPLLPGCSARFQCKNSYCYQGGDHLIFVGEVLDFDRSDRPPLVYHQGGYAVTLPHEKGDTDQGNTGGYVDDFLLPLLARAFRYFSWPFYKELEEADISPQDWRILATLSDRALNEEELSRVIPMNMKSLRPLLSKLESGGLVQGNTSEGGSNLMRITSEGTIKIIELLAAAKAREADVLSEFSQEERLALKQLLRQFISSLEKSWSP